MTDEFKDVKFTGISVTDGKSPSINFEVMDCINAKIVGLSILRTDLTPRNLENLIASNNGICEQPDEICDFLLKNYNSNLKTRKFSIDRYHTQLGWKEIDGMPIYLGQNIVSDDETLLSEYSGKLDLKPRGNIENVVTMLNEEIIGTKEWSKLEAVLSAAVGSLLLSFANHFWNADLNNVILHLFGGSSNGKSTALTLFASVATNPEKKKGYWLIFASTEGSLVKRIGNNEGLPVVIDELSGATKKELDGFVYTIGNGEEKDRLKPGGIGLQESAAFQTVVMSSGEISLLKKCTQNEGLRARCLEFANEQWTYSKSQAVHIKSCLSKNYGLIAPMIAKELIHNSNKWRKRLEFYRERVEQEIEKRNITCSIKDRVGEYVALFTLAGEVTNATLNISLSIDKIFDFFFTHIVVSNDEEANMARNAYYALLKYISENAELFADCGYIGGSRSILNTFSIDAEKEGFYYGIRQRIIDNKEYDMVYVFRPGKAESILADSGFAETKVALFKMRKEGLLKTKDPARNTYTYNINGVDVNCIAIYYQDNSAKIHDIGDED
uniref:DUF927 domain-containing protein n=1 Tax=Lachnospira eligens TaxID=39485 RepID=UPI00402958EB